MTGNISLKMAMKNLISNRLFNFAHVMASSMIIAMVYVCHSLMFNKYLVRSNAQFTQILVLGVIVSTFLAVIFILYSTRFVTKNRKKEFAVYGILGLEKKHILRIIFIENFVMTAIIFFLSTAIGYGEGSFGFMIANKLMEDTGAKLQDYPFSVQSALFILCILASVFVLVMIINSFQIGFSSPIALMSKGKVYEKEPKTKWIILVLGLVLLGAGYYISLTNDNLFSAIKMIIIAVLIVIVATYFLYISLSIFILKMLKRSKGYYYKKRHFMFVNNMMSKMMSNGIALASIAVLITGVILTISITYTTSYNISEAVDREMNGAEYKFSGIVDMEKVNNKSYIEEKKEHFKNLVNSTVEDSSKVDIKAMSFSAIGLFSMNDKKDKLLLPKNITWGGDTTVADFQSVEDYNKAFKTSYNLKEDEILVVANSSKLIQNLSDRLNIEGKTYRVIKAKNSVKVNIPLPYFRIYFNNTDTLVNRVKELAVHNGKNAISSIDFTVDVDWSVKGEGKDYAKKAQDILFKDNGGTFESSKDMKKLMYQFNGGLIMTGVIISLILLIGSGLILYFKQMTEAYDDRENIQIMKKVGLDNGTIKSTMSNQVAWVFLSPLGVALIHCLVASKIVSVVLGIFGFITVGEFLLNMGKVAGIFGIIYLVFFVVTSRLYYKIVK